MLRVSSYTFGCKLNQSETESALAILSRSGYEVVPWEAGADLYLLNTCTVTTKGEQKARRLIRQLQQLWPRAAILAAGCYAILEREKLESLGERVCALPDQPAGLCQLLAANPVASSDELLELMRRGIRSQMEAGGRRLQAGVARQTDFPDALLRGKTSPARPVLPAPATLELSHNASKIPAPKATKQRQRYFLKIQDGCNRSCSFCRIRIARGPSRSLQLPLLVEQLQQLEANGYAEAVITGVHINSYYYCDEASGRTYFLGELLQELLRQTHNIRLRLSSLEPEGLGSERSQQLLRALSSLRICPHFHISLQSGSEHILRQMRRGYTAAQQLHYIDKLKALRPQAFFSCDVIVGFPGEREEDFEATCQLLCAKEFAAVHGFSYSPRPGTDAFAMPKLQDSIVKQRMQRLQTLAVELRQNYLQRCLGQEAQVLLEEQCGDYWLGYSENYIRTRVTAGETMFAGKLLSVRLQAPDRQNTPDILPDASADSRQIRPVVANEDCELLLQGIPL